MSCDREDPNNNDQEDLRDILRNIVQPKFIKLSDVEVKIELMEESEARMLAKFFRSSFIPTKVCSETANCKSLFGSKKQRKYL